MFEQRHDAVEAFLKDEIGHVQDMGTIYIYFHLGQIL